MRRRSSKRAKALQPTPEVKDKVWERDRGRCVWCTLHPEQRSGYGGSPDAHFIPRTKSGLGIEENILTLCVVHHYQYDRTADRDQMRQEFAEYLKSKYPEWDESKLIYRR